LAEYRRRRRIPMVELRAFIELLRDETDTPYPLARYRPFRSGRKLLLAAQTRSQLDPRFYLVATVGRQMLLTPAAESFVERVEWSGDLAGAWRPHDDRRSRVRVSPTVRFGRPAVGGVSTEAIFEQSKDGASNRELAEHFDLSPSDIRWALSYENSRRAS
jgi:uncharacterized protein (DUF433 family)